MQSHIIVLESWRVNITYSCNFTINFVMLWIQLSFAAVSILK